MFDYRRHSSRPLPRNVLPVLFGTALGGLCALSAIHPAHGASTTRVSVATDGTEAAGLSVPSAFALSSNGRYVVFASDAANLVAGDTNGFADVFLRDRQLNTTTRISVATDGTQGVGGESYAPAISGDGRYVAFESTTTNLVVGDTNGVSDIFIRDLQLNTTTRVSVATGGTEGTGASATPTISGNGRYVAFESAAPNLVNGDTNSRADIFVRDLQLSTTTRVNLTASGGEASNAGGDSSFATISSDGRSVAFESLATNLVTDDTNNVVDVFVRDLVGNTTTRVSVTNAGAQASGSGASISGDGRYVAFVSSNRTIVADDTNGRFDVFVRDRQLNTTTRVSLTNESAQATDASLAPTLSVDGRYVVFFSSAPNLVTGDTNGVRDAFVRDRQLNTTTRVNVATDGTQATTAASLGAISSDGRYVAFTSDAPNLVSGDTNNNYDVFVRDRASSTSAASSGLLISEFRQRGKNGLLDEYIEVFNTTNAPLPLNGWTLTYVGGGATRTISLPFDTSIPAFGHYLLVGTGYSLSNYSGTGAATGDQTLGVGIDDASPLTLLNPAGVAQDTVTFGGTDLPSAPTADGEYAFVRQVSTTTNLPVSTPNAFNFVNLDTTLYSGTNGSVASALGAPGPENLASPIPMVALAVNLLDPAVSQATAPNRFRNTAATAPTTSTNGTLAIRRVITNNTNASITRLRFRVTILTTLSGPGYSNNAQADLRLVASPAAQQNITLSNGTVVPVFGTTPDLTIAQSRGGGLNNTNVETSSGAVTLSAALGSGQSRAYDFTFGVRRTGTFTIAIQFEELTGSTSSTTVARPNISLVRPNLSKSENVASKETAVLN